MSEIKEERRRRNVRKARDLGEREWAEVVPSLRPEELDTNAFSRDVSTHGIGRQHT